MAELAIANVEAFFMRFGLNSFKPDQGDVHTAFDTLPIAEMFTLYPVKMSDLATVAHQYNVGTRLFGNGREICISMQGHGIGGICELAALLTLFKCLPAEFDYMCVVERASENSIFNATCELLELMQTGVTQFSGTDAELMIRIGEVVLNGQ